MTTAANLTPSIKFSNYGLATVYVSVPPGRFKREWYTVDAALSSALRGVVAEPPPEILYLIGQADLAARVRVLDFRAIIDLAYPNEEDSAALVYNWVFSVPYDDGGTPTAIAEPTLRFITHLRIRRSAYSNDPVAAEQRIVDQIRRRLDRAGMRATVEAGLGWADLIVSVRVTAEAVGGFLDALLALTEMPLGNSGSPLFIRTLTLVGYEWSEENPKPPNLRDASALMFVRSAPGGLRSVAKLLQTAFPDATIRAVDGKFDLVAFVATPAQTFFADNKELAEGAGHRLIKKIETHVLFGHKIPEFQPDGDDTPRLEAVANEERLAGCTCRKRPKMAIPVDSAPIELQQAIKNLLFLFNSTLSDDTNCCDARPAVLACEASLERLIRALRSLLGDLRRADAATASQQWVDAPTDRKVRNLNENIIEQQRTIEQWVLTSERVLRQRTIGAFEEFLGQSDRAVVYRGGVQKILSLADNLMNDIYAQLVGLNRPYPYFATLYDSVGTILSVVGTGLVRIPARNLFSLAAVIPDLWHEVGVYRFFQKFRFKHFDLDPSKHQIDMFRYRDLADLFGDFVVLVEGFRCDYEHFCISLVQGWLDSQPHAHVPTAAKDWNFAQVVLRLLATLEFLWTRVRPLDVAGSRQHYVEGLLAHVEDVIGRHFGSVAPPIVPQTLGRVRLNFAAAWFAPAVEKLALEFSEIDIEAEVRDISVRRAEDDAAAVPLDTVNHNLRSFLPTTNLNEEFRRLYWQIQSSRLDSPDRRAHNGFGAMAALGRSTAIEYFRRHI